MAKTDRVYKIERLIRSRGHLSFQALLDELEVSPATLKRDLEYLRDRLGAPIEYDRDLNAYRFGAAYRGHKHELPGLWFDERELLSLLTAHELLSELDGGGVISRHLQPLLARIHQMLGSSEADGARLLHRIRIVSPAKRPVAAPFFERVAESLLKRRRLRMRYLTRGRRERLLRFALDAVEAAELLEQPALELAPAEVQAQMDAGYGIYAGGERETRSWALLRFDPQAELWASREQWHAEQQGRWLGAPGDSAYELRVPYVDDTELVMDILRQGPEVEVIEPPALRERVRQRHAEAAARYADRTADTQS